MNNYEVNQFDLTNATELTVEPDIVGIRCIASPKLKVCYGTVLLRVCCMFFAFTHVESHAEDPLEKPVPFNRAHYRFGFRVIKMYL
jgi:hypothetical protein